MRGLLSFCRLVEWSIETFNFVQVLQDQVHGRKPHNHHQDQEALVSPNFWDSGISNIFGYLRHIHIGFGVNFQTSARHWCIHGKGATGSPDSSLRPYSREKGTSSHHILTMSTLVKADVKLYPPNYLLTAKLQIVAIHTIYTDTPYPMYNTVYEDIHCRKKIIEFL